LITFRRSAGRDLGRNSAVSPAVPQPFLSRFSTQMDKKLGLEGQKRLKDHRHRRTRRPQHHPRPSRRHVEAPCLGGGDVGANGCVVGGDILGVSGPQNPIFYSIWVEKRLRNGSETAGGTAEFLPRSRPAVSSNMINDRGELHCHRTSYRGGRALPVPGCSEGRRFPRRSTFKYAI
jgi:hypothetical protein